MGGTFVASLPTEQLIHLILKCTLLSRLIEQTLQVTRTVWSTLMRLVVELSFQMAVMNSLMEELLLLLDLITLDLLRLQVYVTFLTVILIIASRIERRPWRVRQRLNF